MHYFLILQACDFITDLRTQVDFLTNKILVLEALPFDDIKSENEQLKYDQRLLEEQLCDQLNKYEKEIQAISKL